MSDPEQSEPSSTGFYHALQPHRDLQTNWSVDLARNLEDYLQKICSGEIPASSSDVPQLTVNFAEAALLLQGSAQVYSRKVEYLYSLVLSTLESISNNSSEEQATGSSEKKKSRNVAENEDSFWGLDDIPVEPNSLLDDVNGNDAHVNYLVRPPANLVVLEGDCLDAIGDAGELESYLLASNDLFRDFILLDSGDAEAVNEFLGTRPKSDSGFHKGGSSNSKSRKSFLSPSRRSGGSAQKQSAQKNQEDNDSQIQPPMNGFESNFVGGSSPHANDFPEENGYFGGHDGFPDDSEEEEEEEDDDPWKPLNPHEPGNLKVKPFKKGKGSRKTGIKLRKQNTVMADFPVARMDGPISEELVKLWEAKCSDEPRPPSLFEKLRESLFQEVNQGLNAFPDAAENNEDDGYDSEDANEPPGFDMPESLHENEDVPEGPSQPQEFDTNDGYEEFNNASLEDLCRSHLDSLLASLAETEKQTEMAARVSSWKTRIDENLDEQDKRPPFDIHEYGGKVLEKLHEGGEAGSSMSFTDIVKGQAKHDVARSFSALLQLVNNGDIGLEKSDITTEPLCYTAENPFQVTLLENEKPSGEFMARAKKTGSKKRVKSPKKAHTVGEENNSINPPASNGSSSTQRRSAKLGKAVVTNGTPDGKKRRK